MLISEKEELIALILSDLDTSILYRYNINFTTFCNAIASGENLHSKLDVSYDNLSKIIKDLFPNKNKGKLLNYVLSLVDHKVCTSCEKFLHTEDFRLNSSNADGLNAHCKMCHAVATYKTQNYRQSNYNARKAQRTPKWANLETIKEFYSKCPEGYHVDHIIPLNGELVCGLHVENNLQYLTAQENIQKSNKFVPYSI